MPRSALLFYGRSLGTLRTTMILQMIMRTLLKQPMLSANNVDLLIAVLKDRLRIIIAIAMNLPRLGNEIL